jgi:Na+/melibiose symporter-like transporter
MAKRTIKESAQRSADFVKNTVLDVRRYWDKPKPGNYVPYKEVVANMFVVGGAESVNKTFPAALSFGAGCLLLTFVYQIPIQWFTMIGVICGPIGYLWTILGLNLDANLGHISKKTARFVNLFYIPLFIIGVGLLLFAPVTGPGSMERIIPGYWKFWGINLVANIWGAWRNIFWRQLLLEKIGRYKWSMYTNLIPYIIFTCIIIYFPFEKVPLADRAWQLQLCFSFVYNFHAAEASLTNNMTPNEQERISILAYPGTVANGINSIWGFMVPALGTYVGGYQSLGYFRYVLPLTFLAGVVMMYIPLPFVHERVIQPPMEAKPHIDFWYGTDAVLRNKYQWMKAISTVIDGLGTGIGGWMAIMFTFMLRETGWIYALINTILATAYTPGILLSPLFNKIDYKKLYYINRGISVATSIIAILCLLLGVNNPYQFCAMVLSIHYFNTLIGQSMNVVNHNMNTNLGYYQMWISGERMESYTSTIFNWITGPIGAMIGFIIPLIYKSIGYTSNQDVLYMSGMREKVLLGGCVISILGDILCTVPYAWFNFPKRMMKQIIKDLEWRNVAATDLLPVNQLAREGKEEEAQALLQEIIARREAPPPAEVAP